VRRKNQEGKEGEGSRRKKKDGGINPPLHNPASEGGRYEEASVEKGN
jgi:hypothetical protein